MSIPDRTRKSLKDALELKAVERKFRSEEEFDYAAGRLSLLVEKLEEQRLTLGVSEEALLSVLQMKKQKKDTKKEELINSIDLYSLISPGLGVNCGLVPLPSRLDLLTGSKLTQADFEPESDTGPRESVLTETMQPDTIGARPSWLKDNSQFIRCKIKD